MAESVSTSRSTVLLVTAGVLWGTGGLAGAMLSDRAALDPLAVAAYRLLLGGGLATIGCAVLGGFRYCWNVAAVLRVLAVGALLAVFQVAYYLAVAALSVSLATLLTIGSVPVLVAFASAIADRAWPTSRVRLAVGVALTGLVLLCGAGGTDPTSPQTGLGVVLTLCSGAGFASMILLTRQPVPGLPASTVTTAGLLTGGLLLLPIALPVGMAIPMTWPVLGIAGFLAAVPTAIAYGAYFTGSRGATPIASALAVLLEPLTAAVLAVVLLGERLTVGGIVGAALLILALLLNNLANRAGTGR
ncbi:DMT family transporter [Tamaricihabitans halophyticus]|uniref:DMT family transporter n=1 Tax=Tamaricihabitans halophyticus TaxID=1262583 RepID=UPI001FB3E1B4|nr:DMT family transporter [Tamaricihabitans halophyticus]